MFLCNWWQILLGKLGIYTSEKSLQRFLSIFHAWKNFLNSDCRFHLFVGARNASKQRILHCAWNSFSLSSKRNYLTTASSGSLLSYYNYNNCKQPQICCEKTVIPSWLNFFYITMFPKSLRFTHVYDHMDDIKKSFGWFCRWKMVCVCWWSFKDAVGFQWWWGAFW